MNSRKYYAHTLEGRPPSEWQGLREHLENVAELARSFASDFDGGDWARLAGLWHDVGKYQDEFQDYLLGNGKGVDHAIVGALLSNERDQAPDSWLPLAFVIAGHHTGLANLTKEDGRPRPLQRSLKEGAKLLTRALPNLPKELCQLDSPELPGPECVNDFETPRLDI